jgi:hypothetical protein
MISDIEWVETIWLTAFLDIFQEQVVWCQETVRLQYNLSHFKCWRTVKRHSIDVKTALCGSIEFANIYLRELTVCLT